MTTLLTAILRDATDDTTPQSSRFVYLLGIVWDVFLAVVNTTLLFLGVLCAGFFALQYSVQLSCVATAAAGDALKVAPAVEKSSSIAAEPDVNLAILKIAH